MRGRQQRQRVGADFISDIAAGRNPIGPDNAGSNPTRLQQLSGGRVHQHRDRNAVLRQFPSREPRTLKERPRLIDKHFKPLASLPSSCDRA